MVHYVAARGDGVLSVRRVRRDQLIDPYLEKLMAMGYRGSERTARRGVAPVMASWCAGHRGIYRPWVCEPGLWFQFDFGDGPTIGGGQPACSAPGWRGPGSEWCSRSWDRTLPTVIACVDTTLRRFGGCPTYALTDCWRFQ